MAKTLISIRLEEDLLDWYKAVAPHAYQTKIQAVLLAYQLRKTAAVRVILNRAQQIFVQSHARCFWHLRQDLQITAELIPLIQSGLRKYGGLAGMRLADELDLSKLVED